MAQVYTDVKRGRIDSQDGARRTYILSQVGKVIEMDEFERRIEALERARR
jgi:hypothetical protein